MVIAGVVVIFGLAAVGSMDQPDTGSAAAAITTPSPTSQLTSAPTAASTSDLVPMPESTFGPTSPTTEATVVRVIDGDTIVVTYGGEEYKVRYIGMDAPETKDPNSPIEWMGPQATEANAALVAGETVFLEKDVSEVDRFDRLLRYVWLADGTAWTLVNLELVRQGVAIAKSYPPDVRYDGLYQRPTPTPRGCPGSVRRDSCADGRAHRQADPETDGQTDTETHAKAHSQADGEAEAGFEVPLVLRPLPSDRQRSELPRRQSDGQGARSSHRSRRLWPRSGQRRLGLRLVTAQTPRRGLA